MLGERERSGEEPFHPAVRRRGHLPVELLKSLIDLLGKLVVAQISGGVGDHGDAVQPGAKSCNGSPVAPEVRSGRYTAAWLGRTWSVLR